MGAVTPLGLSAEETWKNMLAGVSGADTIPLYCAKMIDMGIILT